MSFSIITKTTQISINIILHLHPQILSSSTYEELQACVFKKTSPPTIHTQIEAITVGNEVFIGPHNTTNFSIPAMRNIHQALVQLENLGVVDIDNNLRYFSLFNARIDVVFTALSALNYHDVPFGIWTKNLQRGLLKCSLKSLGFYKSIFGRYMV
ncbi:hypothetical protein ACFE04_030399 [Oxalis oulophora]